MKKTAWILLFTAGVSLASIHPSLSAQTDSSILIDSPSHILLKDKNTTTKDSENTASNRSNNKEEEKATDGINTTSRNTNITTSEENSALAYEQKSPNTTKKDLKRKGKLVYVSLEIAPIVNWYSGIERPFDRKGATVIVNPSLFVEFDMGYYIFLGTGFTFNTTGGRLSFPSDYINQHENNGLTSYYNVLRSYSASYAELPLYIRVQSNPINNWSFFGSVGANFGVRVSSKYKDIYEDFNYADPNNPDMNPIEGDLLLSGKLKDKTNLWAISGVFKLGTSYKIMGTTSFRFGLGYHCGFIDALTKYHEQPKGVQPNLKTQQFELFVGVTF